MKPKKLFHTIVVVGAALTGGACGSSTPPTDSAIDSSTADSAMMADSSMADSAMDATTMLDSGMPDGGDADADSMVLIL